MTIAMRGTGLIAAELTASTRSGRVLDRSEIYTVRYRTYLIQHEPRAGDEGFR